ncbi:acyl-CoA dehydrogenase family protein [Cryptosporangium aurantiacum]|uniref:Acyl-CoA dehydrogenase n=1 Tax=Cryptosporangium aurantiacum TaxID=134849 RepID=A0A1M7KQ48_9ACTN|nr:acyl-CoA dehydrogenase family protein [Cryptosporangium aurantiacum]SHM67541.1 Acyl-CoA dehydrogenase [Cryptosporangium aurantiacum]
MDFDLTPDQKLFRATTKKFLEAEVPLTTVRELSTGPHGFARDWWTRGAELGWTTLLVPEDQGGGSVSDAGLLDLLIVAEEMGRLVSPGPLVPVNTVLAALVDAGGHADSVERLVAGEAVGTWAVYEPGSGWTPDDPGVTATPTDDGWTLSGVKDRVEAADQADLFLVTVRAPEGPTQFLVPADAAGLRVEPSWSLDLVRRFGSVAFDDVRVSASALVGRLGAAEPLIDRQRLIASVLQSAETAGAVDRVLEFTIAWAFDRYSFGRPLASYQALKHRFADMKTWLEASHGIVSAAGRAVQDRSADAADLVSAAASYVGSKATDIIQDCVQLHGGIGVTWEHDLHLYLRRATVNRALYGTPEEHRRALAEQIIVRERAAA